MAIKYLKDIKATLRDENGNRLCTLIWGDPVHVLEESGTMWKVRARARTGRVDASALGDESLLELYVIDVGQGDGMLMRTPDDNWHLIDGGVSGEQQMTRKGAANFLRWKFLEDLALPGISLANVIVTHPDFDHYGGVIDVLRGRLADGRRFEIAVENFYHSGIGIYRSEPTLGETVEGEVPPFPIGGHRVRRRTLFITDLLDGADTFRSPTRAFQDSFAEYAALVATVPATVKRLSSADGSLPGYGPGGDLSIRVLGPLVERFDGGRTGLRSFTNDAVTRNGHSIVLRVDYRDARVLLTGDLNTPSQRLLLSYQPDQEFAVDVAKACHHGSEDVYLRFLQAMRPRATVISSGDAEDYSHPRPVIIGASARYGRESRVSVDEVLPPLVYSTELARSVKLAYTNALTVRRQQDDGATVSLDVDPLAASIRAEGYRQRFRRLPNVPLSTDLIYGLVNVRTDGRRILCATLEERGSDFDVKVFQAGVDV